MGHLVRLPLRVVLIASLGAFSLLAQSGKAEPSFEVKVRNGLTFGNLKSDLHNTKLMGLGVEGAFAFGAGNIVAQLDYTYIPGGDYDNMPGTTFDSRTLAVTSSVDRRKLKLEGFGARVGYRAPLFSGFDWQAGLALNRFRATEEVSGTLRPAGSTTATYESLMYTPETAKIAPSLYVGAKYRVNNVFSLEANVMSVGYSTVKWQPYWYTGVNTATSGNPIGASKTETRNGLAVEIAIGLRL